MVHGPIDGNGGGATDANERNPSATESKMSRGGKMAYGQCRTGLGDEMRRGRGGNLSRGVARCKLGSNLSGPPDNPVALSQIIFTANDKLSMTAVAAL